MNQSFFIRGLRLLLIEHPCLDGKPLFRSIRDLATDVATNGGATRFQGKPSSASVAISAVLRGDRPYTQEVKGAIKSAIDRRLKDAPPEEAAKITRAFEKFEVKLPYSKLSRSGTPFEEFLEQLESSYNTILFVTGFAGFDLADNRMVRLQIINQLGLCASAGKEWDPVTRAGKGHSGKVAVTAMYAIDQLSRPEFLERQDVVTHRITFMFPSLSVARFTIFKLLQEISDQDYHDILDESEKLEIGEALRRIRRLLEIRSLRIYSVDLSHCYLPLAMMNPSDSSGSTWLSLGLGGDGRPNVIQMVSGQSQFAHNAVIPHLETNALQGQESITWEDLDAESLAKKIRQPADS